MINPVFWRLVLQFQSKWSNQIILSRKGRKEEKSENDQDFSVPRAER